MSGFGDSKLLCWDPFPNPDVENHIPVLTELQQRQPMIGNVRGRGLMIGAELVDDRESKTPALEACEDVVQRCFQKGLLLLTCGESTIRFCPPLVVTEEQAHVAVGIVDEVLSEVTEIRRQRL